ncbi:unnamed protein product [Calicophoron daubneyi]|uniref:Thyrotropin-releasing hormone receptor n=1 Tax=Calicophoron daubneyi TaxID=300641 RepID=A0AAV2TKU2_CALDB
MDDNSTIAFNQTDVAIIPYVYFSVPYKVLGTISLVIILSVGFIGNALVLPVIIFSPGMHTPTNCYLASLSASDLLVLLSTTTLMLKELYSPYGLWDLGTLTCRLSVCVQYLTVAVSALCICAFSVERWVGICFPIKAHYMCTVSRALRIIAGIWVFATLYNIPWMFIATTQVRQSTKGPFEVCTFKYKRSSYKTVYILDFILYYAIPLFITSILYAHISWNLFRISSKNNALPQAAGPVEYNSNTIMSPLSQQQIQMFRARNRTRSRKQVVKLLMAVVLLFASCWLPYRFVVVFNSFSEQGYHDLWFRMFARLMAFLNSAANPLVYNIMSRKFRRAFRRLLRCSRFRLQALRRGTHQE